MDYMITNIAITLVMLATVKSMTDAPAKLQLSLLLAALISWFIPWHSVELTLIDNIQLIPSNIDYILPNLDTLLEPDYITGERFENSQALANFSQQIQQVFYHMNFNDFFLLSIMFGLTWFLLDVYQYLTYLAKLNKTAQNANYILAKQKYSQKLLFNRQIQLKISPLVPTAMAIGTIKPVIWLNKEEVKSSELNSILLHEITHLEKFDPLLKWLTQLAKRIFFWNPLVNILLKKIDLLIEMRCDQKCFEIKREQYCIDLAQIVLNSQQQLKQIDVNISGFTSINSQANANMIRLESLTKEKPMQMKYIAIATCSILFSSIAVADINFSPKKTFVPDIRTFRPSIDLHQSALNLKARRENGKKLKIYLAETEKNYAYNKQMKQLVQLSKNALSPDNNELNEIAHNIESWYSNRQPLSPWQEKRIKFNTFAVQHFLLQKQQKNAEIIDLVSNYFGSLEGLPQAYRHRTASALLSEHQSALAMSILAQFNFDDVKVAIGNVTLMVSAYMQQGEYESALNLLDKRLAQQPSKKDIIRLLTVKYQVLNFMGVQAQAEDVKEMLTNQYNINQVSIRDFSVQPVELHWAPVLDHI